MLAGPVIARFRRRLPLVRLEIVLQDQLVDLLRDGVDVAIRGGELPDSDLVARRLASTTLWLYGSQALREVPLADIPLIVAPGDEAVLRRAGLVVSDAAAVVDDRSAVADAIAWGAGMGLLPPFLGEPGCAQATMARLHDAPVVTMPVHAVYHASQRDDARVRVLVDEIEAQLKATL
jgi:DNA-binding transcriptional LysR family regulator